MTKTKIEWAEHNWNPIVGVNGGWGCNKVSPGCDHCYAEILHQRFGGRGDYESTEHEFVIKQHILEAPFKRKIPTKYFVCSTMDIFHHNITIEHWTALWDVMACSPQHIFMLLTKRPENAWKFMGTKPLPNIWLGVSAENQKYWDKRVPILMSTPAVVHFVSAEPLLDSIDIGESGIDEKAKPGEWDLVYPDWVIIGCESGAKRRLMELSWARKIVEQCKFYGIKPFVKQLPINGKVSHKMDEWPEELRAREWPQ